jgi:hypothetical protein
MQHRYILQPYKGRGSRFVCPNCHDSRRTFTRYIDTQTQTYLADHVGKCDRIDRCGYHYAPRAYFADNPGPFKSYSPVMNHEPQFINNFDTLPRRYMDDMAKAYERNNFMAFLIRGFGEHTALRLASEYKIGTSKHWPGATIFWQLDINDKLRTGKIMLYNPTDGHRVKEPYSHIAWAHSLLAGKTESREVRKSGNNTDMHLSDLCGLSDLRTNFQLRQCFFGEHLLNTDPFKMVAIVESEKTAVICSFFYSDYIWLAAGSLEGLSLAKCRALKDRRVVLFPDVNGFDKWKLKARELNLRLPTATFTLDKTLERTATPEERAQGIDLADRWIEQIKQMKQWKEN